MSADILQLNKRDLPNAEPVAELVEAFSRGRPVVEAVAADGVGVLTTLRAIVGEISAETAARIDWAVLVPRTGLRAIQQKRGSAAATRAKQRGLLAKLFGRLFE